jgi:hypothetical protein
MKMTREEAVTFWRSLSNLGSYKGAKFAYAIAKNRSKLESEYKLIQKMQSTVQPSSLKKFDERRIELCKEYADKDENGNPSLENNNYVISQRRDEFENTIRELQKEFEPSFKEFEENQIKFNNFLSEEIEVDIHTIPMSIIPEDMTAKDMEIIIGMITEE